MATNLGRFALRLISNAKIYNTVTADLLSSGWVSLGSGQYRQLVTLPTGKTFDNSIITFKNSTTKDTIHFGITKDSETAYYVYSNANTISATIFYTS